MSNDRIARVHYFPQQFLRTEDFNAEQAYHLEMRRRHNIAHHSWGVVYGLQLVSEEDGLFIQPGMAVDGFGRELILPQRYRIPLSEFDARDTDRLDVWLLYNRSGSDQAPAGFSRCDTEAQAAFYRWQELPAVRLKRPDPNYPDPRRPQPVADAGIESVPFRRPPDDPEERWPVFLGRVLRDRSDPEQPAYSIDVLGRPVAGLVGDVVVSPSRRALVIVGDTLRTDASEDGQTVQQTGRFSVALRHEEQLNEHLRIQGPGELDVFGSTRLHGNLVVAGGSVRFQTLARSDGELPPYCVDSSLQEAAPLQRFSGQASGELLCGQQGAASDETKELHQPWSIYRHRCRHETDLGEDELIDQLRIEMGPGETGTSGQVVIGAWSPDAEAFKPILTVDNSGENGTVTVHGDLAVRGDIRRDVAASTARLSPQAQNFLLGTFSSGVGGANLQLPQFYRSPFGDQFNVCDDSVQDAVVNVLIGDSDCLSRFVDKLLARSAGRTAVGQNLEANMGYWTDVLDPALSSSDSASRNELANAVLDEDNGRTAVGDNLAVNSTRLDATLAPVLADTTARDTLAALLASDPTGPASMLDAMPAGSAELTDFTTLLEDPIYFDRLPAFATHILATSAGQTAAGDDLVADTGRIAGTTAPVLDDTAARAELARVLVNDANGPTSVMDAMPASSDVNAPLNQFAALLESDVVTYADRLPAFTTRILATTQGRTVAGDDLVTDNSRLGETLGPVMANDPARTVLADILLSDSAGRTSAGQNLLANPARWTDVAAPALNSANSVSRDALAEVVLVEGNGRDAVGDNLAANPTRLDATLAPVLTDAALENTDTASRDALAEQIMRVDVISTTNGQNAVLTYLEPSPASDTPRAAFVALIDSGSYPTLKGDICATCP